VRRTSGYGRRRIYLAGLAGPVSDPVADLAAAMLAGGGVNSMHNFTASVLDGAWSSSDLSGNGNTMTQATGFLQPTTAGVFDANTRVHQAFGAENPSTVSVVMSVDKSDASTDAYLVDAEGSGSFGIRYTQGSALTMEGVVYVAGVLCTTRGELFDALHQAGRVVVSIFMLPRANASQLEVGRGSISFAGTVYRVAVIDEGNIADLAKAQSDAAVFVSQ